MKTSIIIPTYGRPGVFKKCLDSIEELNAEFEIIEPFEVIVINNNDSEELRKETSKVCEDSELPVEEVKLSSAIGSVKARNIGIKKSKGEILIFFDDDVIVQEDYFKELMKNYNSKKVGAVGGAEIKRELSILHKLFFKIAKPGSISWSGEIVSNFLPKYKKKFFVVHLHGSNFSIRKAVINEIGLMDEEMEGHYRDETEFTYRVHEQGYKLIFEPKARVIHKPSSKGGNVSPEKRKEWAYWYHRNTSYFFFKHLYKEDKVKLLAYLIREGFMSLVRALLYKNIHYVLELSAIKEGKRLTE